MTFRERLPALIATDPRFAEWAALVGPFARNFLCTFDETLQLDPGKDHKDHCADLLRRHVEIGFPLVFDVLMESFYDDGFASSVQPGAVPYFFKVLSTCGPAVEQVKGAAALVEFRQELAAYSLQAFTGAMVNVFAHGHAALRRYDMAAWMDLTAILAGELPDSRDAYRERQEAFWTAFGDDARKHRRSLFRRNVLASLAEATMPEAAKKAQSVLMGLETVYDSEGEPVVPYPAMLGLSSIIAAHQGRRVDNIGLLIDELDDASIYRGQVEEFVENSGVLSCAMRAVYTLNGGDVKRNMAKLLTVLGLTLPDEDAKDVIDTKLLLSRTVLLTMNTGAKAASQIDTNSVLVHAAALCSARTAHLPFDEPTVPLARIRTLADNILKNNGPV